MAKKTITCPHCDGQIVLAVSGKELLILPEAKPKPKLEPESPDNAIMRAIQEDDE